MKKLTVYAITETWIEPNMEADTTHRRKNRVWESVFGKNEVCKIQKKTSEKLFFGHMRWQSSQRLFFFIFATQIWSRSGPDLPRSGPIWTVLQTWFRVLRPLSWFGVPRPPFLFYEVLVPPFFLSPDLDKSGAVPKLERNWPDLGEN